jgi:dimethyladenosine transferase 1
MIPIVTPVGLRLPPLPSIRDIIRLYKLNAKKQLSQNFLLDSNISRKIVRSAGSLQDGYVCEVGPGPGGITRAILESGIKQLIVIEKDERFMSSLVMLNEASGGMMRIFLGDVVRFDMQTVFPAEMSTEWSNQQTPNLHIIGNLPFSVSTPLIIHWLEDISLRRGAWSHGRVPLTLTFQKEVAQRMVAATMRRQRCRLSVMCQYLCDVQYLFTINGQSFVPAPEVDVGVVHFVPHVEPRIRAPFRVVEKLVRHVFHYRPKMCKHGLQTLFPPERPDLTARILEMSDIHADSRSFMLSIEDFDRLCQAYQQLCEETPGLFEYDYRSKENAANWRVTRPSLTV